jgi:hypothetical protein
VRVAVVGGGIYGCVAALDLAAAGHTVDLFERHSALLHGASRANQGRLHKGYHYPRSLPTALAARSDAEVFAARFAACIDRTATHHYAVAAQGSRTSPADYLAFCDQLDGDRTVVTPVPGWLRNVEVCVRVPEAFINLPKLRQRLRGDLDAAGVRVVVDAVATFNRLHHKLIVMATYGQHARRPLRYEVCEVAAVELDPCYAGRSVVVMDGPFTSLDPIPGTRLHWLYDVDRSVHHTADEVTEIPEVYGPLLDQGLLTTPRSRVDEMLDRASVFLRRLGRPVRHGSMFTVRAVLPDVDATDARPTLLDPDPVDPRMVWLTGGKLDGAITAATRVVELAAERSGVAVSA